MKGAELFKAGNFFEFVNMNIKEVSNICISRDFEKNRKNANTLYHLAAACEKCGYYCDYLEVLKKLHMVRPLTLTNWDINTLILFSNFTLEALLYCLFNNEIENLGINYNISEQIESVLLFQDVLISKKGMCYTKQQQDLRALYNDLKQGKLPIYVVDFLYPFEPIVTDYVFDLSQCYPYISLEVKKVPRDKDSYTSYRFKVRGLIKPDMLWRGPKQEKQEKMPPIKKALSIVNMMLLQAVKASPGKMILPYSIEQVSTVTMLQYRWDEKEPILGGTITGTDFTAQWVGGNAPWHSFTKAEMLELNKRIVCTYSSRPFVTTFHHATNLLSAGFNLEGFLLLCASCEGMAYYWCEEIAKLCGIEKEYRKFSETKISKCDSCELFMKSSIKKPFDGMEPTIFANFDFLFREKCIKKEEYNDLKKYLSKVRNDKLRNKTTHGSNNEISKQEAEKSLEALLKMQDLFVEITNRLKEARKE